MVVFSLYCKCIFIHVVLGTLTGCTGGVLFFKGTGEPASLAPQQLGILHPFFLKQGRWPLWYFEISKKQSIYWNSQKHPYKGSRNNAALSASQVFSNAANHLGSRFSTENFTFKCETSRSILEAGFVCFRSARRLGPPQNTSAMKVWIVSNHL